MVECQLPKLIAAGSIPVPRSLFLIFAFVLIFVGGCATVEEMPTHVGAIPPQGIYHKVRSGETIWRIAKMYNVPVEDLVRANNIPNIGHIEKNQLILIPGTDNKKEVVLNKEAGKSGDFDWPLKGKVLTYFGSEGSFGSSNGIDIQASAGEKVLAARDGKVVFADNLNGYGYTVILDHADNFYSVYAQNAGLLVKIDDVVSKGTPIAQAGENKGLALLHFEIRKNALATNPLYYLP